MLQSIKRFWWLGLLVAGVQPALGFALLGPFPASTTAPDGWQQPVIGYQQNTYTFLIPGSVGSIGGPVSLGDIGFPKNIGEGYRRNTPVIYYTYDANFLGYFGSNGVAAVDSAFAIMNKVFATNPVTGQFLPNGVDSLSAGLSEYPPETLHINYKAQSLYLTDLKSVTLHCLVEQLGLATPERYTWTLEARSTIVAPPVTCPLNQGYLVIQRNFGDTPSAPNQLQYSPYVNDTLYTYEIVENCPPTVPTAYTAPFSVDPSADMFTAVAANNVDALGFGGGLGIGAYYTGLTRDDVAGLRYLYASNNINWETAAFIPQNGSSSLLTASGNNGVGAANLIATNLAAPIVVTSADLNALLTFAQANGQAAVQAAFPNVVVASSTSSFVPVCTTNLVASIPNQNFGAPYPNNFGALVLTPTVNCGYQQIFATTFGNVITNGNLANNPNIVLANTNISLTYSSNTVATVLTTSLTANSGPGQPYPPPPVTNANAAVSTATLPVPSGEYIILPPGACGFNILGELTNQPVFTTNLVSTATNANGFVDTVSTVTSFTPHQFLVQPINCTNVPFATGLYEGIEKIQFVRADFDSLLGRFFQPVTNNYTMTMITNSHTVVQRFQRVVSAPDILLTAANDVTPILTDGTVTRSAMPFDMDNIGAGLAGPGTINPRTTISYNKIGDAFGNAQILGANNTNFFVLEKSQMPVLQWASFDASTNDPVLYPNGTSIANLQNQTLVRVTPPPPTLPDGTNAVVYPPQTFTASGGAFSPPFTWSLATGSQPMPSGLYFTNSVAGAPNDTIAGTPTNNPTGPFGAPFDFTVQLTDSLGRSVNWNYTITIH